MQKELIQDGQYNIGHICTRKQCGEGLEEKTALEFITRKFEKKSFTFRELDIESNRVANLLSALSVKKGDVVFTLLDKSPEQFFVFLGTLKLQVVIGTLFSNFGLHALLDRLTDARPVVLFTKKKLFRKIDSIREYLPELKYVVLIDIDEHLSEQVLSYRKLTEQSSDCFETGVTTPDVPSVLHYTSGSTGKPKGVLHVHRAVVQQHMTARDILNLNPGEKYWCTADQGWVTGTSYGIIGPWSTGVTQVHFEGTFTPESFFRILSDERVTVLYTAPTLLRMLLSIEDSFYRQFDLSALKHIFCVGEPLNPEVINWARRVLGKDIHDTWFQTETGAIMIANRPGMPIKVGSMGKPVENIKARILSKNTLCDAGIDTPGYLCLHKNWPSMFITYMNNQSVYDTKFKDDLYFSGDEAKIDEDGYFWFLGRSDDIMNVAGHLISPFEIESALLELPEIAESAAVSIPDPVLFEGILIFVKLKPGITDEAEEIKLKIRLYLSNKVSTYATPKEVIFTDSIPKNKSGKIMRRYLKSQYLGTDPGDISTLDKI